jgi:hypothetical protein
MRKSIRIFALASVMASVGIIGVTTSAEAAVPTCVSTSTWNSGAWNWASAYNGCSSSQRFYFRWDRAVDGGCNTVAVGRSRSEGRLYQARFAGLSSC